ncbi:unnamed protein product [Prorocentrum cordatum]|uniref:Uncharacterized protein n=1 Tax=Prorocentrum cordatum TaxID=2364126 RepID=A0ABN9UR45_9DINO|nr:unnamed protein product [Polarella glacialis]
MGSDEEEEDEEDEEDEAAPFLACTARPGLPAAKTRTVRRSGQTVQPRGRRTQAIDAERARGRARTSWASGGRACGLAPGGRRDCGREQGSRGAERAPREGVRRRGARRRQADPASRWPPHGALPSLAIARTPIPYARVRAMPSAEREPGARGAPEGGRGAARRAGPPMAATRSSSQGGRRAQGYRRAPRGAAPKTELAPRWGARCGWISFCCGARHA